MNAEIFKGFKAYRRRGYTASWALSNARTDHAFRLAEDAGLVRIRVQDDPYTTPEDIEGDMYNPRANPDISPARLERERKAFVETFNREGAVGVVGEYATPDGTWEHGDSVWGMLGNDTEHCLCDVKAATLAAFRSAMRKRCPCCRRVRN